MIDRLRLDDTRLEAMAQAIEAIAQLADPVGRVLAEWQADSGLSIQRVATPIGVIGVIYESRPNVTADAAALCVKAGNAVVLRGGSEAQFSNQAILNSIRQGLDKAAIPADIIQHVPSQSHEAVGLLLQMNDSIDVLVPRGGPSLIKRVMSESRIPLFQHLQGICHTYVHSDANPTMALKIVVNAKMRRTGICGATETLLIDQAIATSLLAEIAAALTEQGCELRGCEASRSIYPNMQEASESDWQTEYLDAILAVKVVADIDEAIRHIEQYSSSHTDAIISDNQQAVAQFMQQVDSAIVMHNTATQFADGGEFGMGAEIGIATGKLHARGPVGVEQLTTFQYHVTSPGLTRP